jgi:hypothetical protein
MDDGGSRLVSLATRHVVITKHIGDGIISPSKTEQASYRSLDYDYSNKAIRCDTGSVTSLRA